MEIIRKEELHQMINIIQKNPYGKFLISGAAGSGKTFLLNILGKVLQESGKEVKYRSLSFYQTRRYKHYVKEQENIVYLFDGLDVVYKPTIYLLLRYVEKQKIKIVISNIVINEISKHVQDKAYEIEAMVNKFRKDARNYSTLFFKIFGKQYISAEYA